MAEFIVASNSQCTKIDTQFEALVETDQVKLQVEELLHAWVEKLETDSDAKTAAIAGSWAIYGLALKWNHDKNRPPLDEFATHVLPLAISNLRLIQERA